MPRKLTQKEFEEKLKQQNKHANDIEVLEPYKNRNTKILCKCKKCGHEWETTPNCLLKGRGCPKCAGNIKLTHKEFMQKFYKQNKYAHDIEILGTYINSTTKIKCKCKKDGYEWGVVPNSLLQGTGCPKCGGTGKLTHKEFINRLQQVNPNIQVLGTYTNNSTKIKCRCKIDGYEWEVKPNCLLSGHGCPKCKGKRQAQTLVMTHEEFMERLHQLNSNIELLGTYTVGRNKIKCKCKVCGHEWTPTSSSLLRGKGCPKCSTSKGEKRIAQYLDNLGINYIYNMCYFNDLVGTGGGLLRPDFIIPSLKIWIEYDGIQHYEPTNFTGKMSEQQIQSNFKKVQENDQIKNQYAKDNNWTLIRIPYYDYDNIEQILAAYIEQEQVI